ncbi:acyltransferase family protein [Epilithonimonas hungarica]|uniref:acyltransferase family protein n=2 Tax=Epilithonimonas hungarica TaxID=454006 RepID=UPI0027D7935E|nr:acyltransferase [Epilithonimonas hungarica]
MNSKLTQKFYGLDNLRAFAIIFVFLFHYFILSGGEPEWLPDVARFGWTGVDLFFVLSGFLISSQLFQEVKNDGQLSLKNFFLKRVFRILPAYFFTVGLYFCLPFFRERESLPPFWKFLTFTQNLGLNLKDEGTFSHCWSLCVEEHFYLFLPLILMLIVSGKWMKRAYWVLVLFFIFGIAIRIYSYNDLYMPNMADESNWMYWYKYVYYPTYNRLDGLLAGVLIAGLYHFYPKVWNRISPFGNLILCFGLMILVSAYFLCENQMSFEASVFGFPLIALGYGLFVLGAIAPTSFLYKWNSTILSRIATLSYAVYLTHKGVVHMTHQLFENYEIDSNLMLMICMMTCIGFAQVIHLVVEKPFMKLRKRFVK